MNTTKEIQAYKRKLIVTTINLKQHYITLVEKAKKKKKADWDEPLYVLIIHSKHCCMKHNYSVLE